MSPEQRGYFIQLLAEAWDSDRPGYLPKDVPLWWLAGAKDEVTFKGSSRLVEDQFKVEVGTGRLYNQRLVDERAAQIEWREKCSKGGKNSGRSRQRKLEVKGSSSKDEVPIENTTNKDSTLQSVSSPVSLFSLSSSDLPSTDVKRFVKPKVGQIQAYMEKSGLENSQAEAEKFIDHYQSNGWKVGKNPMKDWQATVRTWTRNHNEGNGNGFTTRTERETARTAEVLTNFTQRHS